MSLSDEESELKARLESLQDMRHELVPVNDAKIRKLSQEHATLLSLGEVEEAYAKLARIESVRESSNLIIREIGRIEGRLKEIERQKAEMANGK